MKFGKIDKWKYAALSLADLRNKYIDRGPSWVPEPTNQEIVEARADESVGFLEYTALCIKGAKEAIIDIGINPTKDNRQKYGVAQSQKYLREKGFALRGFANEAIENGDEEVAIQALAIVAELISEEVYAEVINRRLDPKTRNFRLTKDDLKETQI